MKKRLSFYTVWSHLGIVWKISNRLKFLQMSSIYNVSIMINWNVTLWQISKDKYLFSIQPYKVDILLKVPWSETKDDIFKITFSGKS